MLQEPHFTFTAATAVSFSCVHEQYPNKNLYLTEQSVGGRSNRGGIAIAEPLSRVLIGAARNGTRNVLLWNLAADPHSGPHTGNGGCTGCFGAITSMATGNVDSRWETLQAVAQNLGIEIKPELGVGLDRDIVSPKLGYPVVQQLLAINLPFTAPVAFNNISAIGDIRALQDFNLRVPNDVSVIGFDDIKAAAFSTPRLTTINQPLEEIGRIATQALLNRIHETIPPRDEITVEPELIIRESTGPVKS